MKRIELTDLELKMLKLELEEGFSTLSASEDEIKAMVSVIQKADDLMSELDAYDELGDSLLEWFYEKYNKQK